LAGSIPLLAIAFFSSGMIQLVSLSNRFTSASDLGSGCRTNFSSIFTASGQSARPSL
jgi:hypothetical protein